MLAILCVGDGDRLECSAFRKVGPLARQRRANGAPTLARRLDALRAPAAFPGWFRRIVYKHCDRILRSRPEGRPLAEDAATESADPSGLLLAKERGLQLETAMAGLMTPERQVIHLFYTGDYDRDLSRCARLNGGQPSPNGTRES